MNCMDCRRRLLTTPQSRDPEIAAHLAECPGCARLAREQSGFEHQLAAAMRVPVPENLHNRVRFAASMRRRRPARWLAAAAAIGVVAVSLTLGGWEYRTSTQLARGMQTMPAASQSVTDPRLARLEGRLEAFLEAENMGTIVSARERPMLGRRAAEFEIVHGGERASVFMVPDTWLATTHDIEANGMPGMLIPFEGGVIGVFCPDREMLRRFAANVRASMSLRG